MVKMRPNESVLSPQELERQQEEGRVAFEKLAMFGREGEEGGDGDGESGEEEEGMITAPEEEEEDDQQRGQGEGWVSRRMGKSIKAVSRREWDEVLGVADVRLFSPHLLFDSSRLKILSPRSPRSPRLRRSNPYPLLLPAFRPQHTLSLHSSSLFPHLPPAISSYSSMLRPKESSY